MVELLLLASLALAIPDSTVVAAAAADTTEAPISFRLIPPRLDTFGIAWIPQGTISTSRGLGFGAEGALPFRVLGDTTSRLSELRAGAILTTKMQARVGSALDVNWDRDRNSGRLRLDYSSLAMAFFGVGPESQRDDAEYYEPNDFLAYLEYQRSLGGVLQLGLRLEYEYHGLTTVEEGGILETGRYYGTEVSDVLGAGLTFNFDTRDRRYDPTKGWYVQGFAMAFDENGVGDHDFELIYGELRHYRRWRPGFTLAEQLFVYSARGGAPFWRLASLGGRHHTRGYQRNRWLDETLLAGQVEGRWRLPARFGVVAFASAAAVNHSVRDMRFDQIRPSFGVGLRYFLRAGEKEVPVRLDFAAGWRSFRLILDLGDAF